MGSVCTWTMAPPGSLAWPTMCTSFGHLSASRSASLSGSSGFRACPSVSPFPFSPRTFLCCRLFRAFRNPVFGPEFDPYEQIFMMPMQSNLSNIKTIAFGHPKFAAHTTTIPFSGRIITSIRSVPSSVVTRRHGVVVEDLPDTGISRY